MGKKASFFSKRNTTIILLGLILSILFFAFTLLVRTDMFRSFDFNATVKLQDRIPLKFDTFFSFLSVIGRFEYTAGALILFLLLRRKISGIIPFFLFGAAHLIELIGKTILNQPGPPNMFLRSQFSEFPGLYVHTAASYPSGHSLRIVFLGILFAVAVYRSNFYWPIKMAFYSLFAFIATAMLISRVSLGEHWTTDVIGGSILGISFAIISIIFI